MAASTTVSPSDQMSESKEYRSPLMRSGDMYVTVPTCVLYSQACQNLFDW